MEGRNGVVNVFKPEEMNSFKVVMALRRIFQTKRVGHIGTLDPFATGVLPVCIGRATGVARYTEDYEKRYRVVISFGARTDTQDFTGQILEENYPTNSDLKKIKDNDFSLIKKALKDFEGDIWQLTPMYSARKVNGTPLYKYARKGIDIPRKKKKIHIFSAKFIEGYAEDELTATIEIHCSSGTYIRTICDDLGEKLGFFAHARELTRLSCGPFTIENSVHLSDIESLVNQTPCESLFGEIRGFYSPDYAITFIPKRILSVDDARRISQGQTLDIGQELTEEKYRIYTDDGLWVGVIKKIQDTSSDNITHQRTYYKAERVFANVK